MILSIRDSDGLTLAGLIRSLPCVSLSAVDPGETTGYAWCMVGRKELLSAEPFHEMLPRLATDTSGYGLTDARFDTAQISCYPDECNGSENIWARVAVAVHQTQRILMRSRVLTTVPHFVVMEDFILREDTKDRSLLSPVRIAARVEQLLYRDNKEFDTVWTLQSASDAKSTCTDERMKSWGLWQPGKPHATDATRHVIVALRRIRALLA